MFVCLSVDRFKRCNVKPQKNAVTKLYRCVINIKIKAEFKIRSGPSKSAKSIGID